MTSQVSQLFPTATITGNVICFDPTEILCCEVFEALKVIKSYWDNKRGLMFFTFEEITQVEAPAASVVFSWDFEPCGEVVTKGGNLKLNGEEEEIGTYSMSEIIQDYGVAKARKMAQRFAREHGAAFEDITLPGTANDYRAAVLAALRY